MLPPKMAGGAHCRLRRNCTWARRQAIPRCRCGPFSDIFASAIVFGHNGSGGGLAHSSPHWIFVFLTCLFICAVAIGLELISQRDLLWGFTSSANASDGGLSLPESSAAGSSPSGLEGLPGSPRGQVTDAGWLPGSNTGEYVRRCFAPLLPQAQVLVANAVTVLEKLPRKLLKSILLALRVDATRGVSLAECLVAKLVCLHKKTVQGCLKWLRNHDWLPKGSSEELAQEDEDVAADAEEDQDTRSLRNLVSVSVSLAAEARSFTAFERDVHRMKLIGANLGQKLASRHFATECQACAALVQRFMDAPLVDEVLVGLGVPSDFSIMMDPARGMS